MGFEWDLNGMLAGFNGILYGIYNVVPQFVNAQLCVHNSNFIMVYGRYIERLTMVYEPTYNWGCTTLQLGCL